jgi:ParB-like chromosome segregation protein Spo0J
MESIPASKPQIKMVPIDKIDADQTIQIREGLDNETVAKYRVIIKEHEFMAPMLVVQIAGTDMWLLSKGFHRLAAYKLEGKTSAPCEIRKGTSSDAKWWALTDGQAGLPMTNADKRKAVKVAVEDKVLGEKTDAEIAKQLGVSASFVGDIRRGLTPAAKKERAKKTDTPPAAAPPRTTNADPEQVHAPVSSGAAPGPSSTPSGGAGPALAPVTTRQRKEPDSGFNGQRTKAQALSELRMWVTKDLITEDDVMAEFRTGIGAYVFVPKEGTAIELRVTTPSGHTKLNIKATVKDINFGSVTLVHDGGDITVEEAA